MNEEQRRAMIAAMESALAEVGVEMYSGAQRLKGFLERHRPFLEASCSRETLDAYFASAGEQDEERIRMTVMFFYSLPRFLREFATEIVREGAATMPKAAVGRPAKLTPETRRQIVDSVAAFSKSGVSIGVAQLRVAQQLGVNKRTVQSAWQNRRELAEQPFQSMKDAWRFIEQMMVERP